MLRRRVTNDFHPRSKSGHPPQSTTGVASRSCSQASRSTIEPPILARKINLAPYISAIAWAINGAARIKLTQSRRLMSFNSAVSSAAGAAETANGSSAMPQIGHAPGLSLRTSGCMGQVYSVFWGADADDDEVETGALTTALAGRFRYC